LEFSFLTEVWEWLKILEAKKGTIWFETSRLTVEEALTSGDD